jgi:hypothetical protein
MFIQYCGEKYCSSIPLSIYYLVIIWNLVTIFPNLYLVDYWAQLSLWEVISPEFPGVSPT